MAGLFFCLASADGAGLLFCHSAIQPNTSVYSVFYQVHPIIRQTPQTSAQGFTGLFLRFDLFHRPQYQTGKSGYNAACATLERITAPGRCAQIPGATTTQDAVQVSTDALL